MKVLKFIINAVKFYNRMSHAADMKRLEREARGRGW